MIWTKASAIMGTVHDEVIRPNMVSMGGAKPHTGTIVQPKTGPAIAVTPILAGQVGDRFAQRSFVIALHRHTTLCRSGLPQYTTGSALRHAQFELSVPHHLSASFGA